MTTNQNKKAVVVKPLSTPLTEQQQARIDAATVKTKNNGSHIEKQRKERLAQAEKDKGAS